MADNDYTKQLTFLYFSLEESMNSAAEHWQDLHFDDLKSKHIQPWLYALRETRQSVEKVMDKLEEHIEKMRELVK